MYCFILLFFLLWSGMIVGLPLPAFFGANACKNLHISCKIRRFSRCPDRASSVFRAEAIKNFQFLIAILLFFRKIRRNKLDTGIWIFRSLFLPKKKRAKRNLASAVAVVFQGPFQPKKLSRSFFLNDQVKQKEPKKKPESEDVLPLISPFDTFLLWYVWIRDSLLQGVIQNLIFPAFIGNRLPYFVELWFCFETIRRYSASLHEKFSWNSTLSKCIIPGVSPFIQGFSRHILAAFRYSSSSLIAPPCCTASLAYNF